MPDFLTMFDDKQNPKTPPAEQQVNPTPVEEEGELSISEQAQKMQSDKVKAQQQANNGLAQEDPNQTTDEAVSEGMNQEYNPIAKDYVGREEMSDNPGAYGPEYTQMGFVEKAKRGLAQGIGKQVIGGLGDMFQMANGVIPGLDIANGNAISRFLQDEGNAMAENNKTFLPEEIRNPEFSMETFTHKDFWSGHVSTYIPQLIEWIFISKGAAGLTKNLAKRGVRKATQKMGKDALKKTGKKVSSNVGEQVIKGADEVLTEIANTGKNAGRSSLYTTAGEITKNAEFAAGMAGGGFSMNMLAGLTNSAELVNTNKDLKDPETGEALYTNEELGDMAAMNMVHNMKYIGIDMLSWGMTYAGATGRTAKLSTKLKRSLGLRSAKNPAGKRMFDLKDQRALSSANFKHRANPVFSMLKRTSNALGKPLFEGFEETFQETWEEWSKKRAKESVTGISDEYSNDVGGYMDFYFSKENEATRAISFALGGLGGGVGNVISYIDKVAAEGLQINAKAERLKHNTADAERNVMLHKQKQIRQNFIDNILSDDDIDNDAYIQTLYDQGTIEEEEIADLQKLAQNTEEDFAEAKAMNVKGRFTFLTEKSNQSFYKESIDFQNEAHAETIEGFKKNLSGKALDKKIKDTTKKHDELIASFNEEIAKSEINIEYMLTGKAPVRSNQKTVRDEDGNFVSINLTDEDYNDWYNKTDEQVFAEAKKNRRPENSGWWSAVKNKMSGAVDTVKDKFKKETPNDIVSKEELQDYTDEQINSIEELAPITDDNESDANKAYKKAFGEDAVADWSQVTDEKIKATIFEQANKQIDSFNENVRNAKAKIKQRNDKKSSESSKENTESGNESKGEKGENTDAETEPEVKRQRYDQDTEGSENFTGHFSSVGKDGTFSSKEKTNTTNDNALFEVAKDGTVSISNDKALGVALEGSPEATLGPLFKINGNITAETKGINISVFPVIDSNGKVLTKGELSYSNKPGVAIVTPPKSKGGKASKGKTNKATETRTQEEIYNQDVRDQNKIEEGLYAHISNSKSDDDIATDAIDRYLNLTKTQLSLSPTTIDKARALNIHLRGLFPEQKIQAYTFSNLSRSIGVDAVGYALGSAILIDEKVWHQDPIYMHEFAHIYYAVNPESEEIKELQAKALKNPKMMAEIQKDYLSDIKWRYKSNGRTFYAKSKKIADLTKLYESGKIEVLPMAKQDVIIEEAVVNYLQGPLSLAYNKHFDQKFEPRRQGIVRKFWQKVKNRALGNVDSADNLHNVLSTGKPQPWRTKEEAITEQFIENIKDKDVTASGRASLGRTYDTHNNDKHQEYQAEISNQFHEQTGKKIDTASQQEILEATDELEFMLVNEDADFDGLDLANESNSMREVEAITPHEKRYEYMESKFSKNIDLYINGSKNKEANREILDQTETGVPYKKTVQRNPFKVAQLKTKLTQMAKEETYWAEWVRLIEESPDPLVSGFIDHMKTNNEPDWMLKLASGHFIFTNSARVNTIIQVMGETGVYSEKTGTSNIENKIIDNVINQKKHETHLIIQTIEDVMASPTAFNKIDLESQKTIVREYLNGALEADSIIQAGEITIDGNVYSLEDGINHAIKEGYLTLEASTNEQAQPELHENRQWVKILVENSRKFSSFSLVQQPDGEHTSSRQTDFLLNQMMNDISVDLDKMTLPEFVRKYSIRKKDFTNAKQQAKKLDYKMNSLQDENENNLLETWWWNNKNLGIKPSITMMLGDQNAMNNVNTNFKNSTSHQQFMNETLNFLHNYDKTTYLGSMDIFGNSARNFKISIPSYKGDLTMNGKLSRQGEMLLQKAFTTYLATRVKENSVFGEANNINNQLMTYAEFKEGFYKDSQALQDYILENKEDFSKIELLKPFFGQKALTEDGVKKLTEFMLNRVVHSYDLHQTFRAGIHLNDVVKRNKGLIAPVFNLHKDLRYEMIPWAKEFKYLSFDNDGNPIIDPKTGVQKQELLTNDSGQYILASTGEAMRKRTMGSLDLNHGFKLFSHSIERDNPNFALRTAMMKGYTTELSEENTAPGAEMQGLRPLYELLMQREQVFIKNWQSKPGNENLEYDKENIFMGDVTGEPVYMGIITPVDAEKATLFNEQNMNGINLFGTLDKLGTEQGLKDYNGLLDSLNYDKGEYKGLDGSNFGPQQIMDKQYYKVKLATQAISSILVQQKEGDLKSAMKIQQHLANQKHNTFKKYILNKIKGKNWANGFKKLVIEHANIRDSDPFTMLQFLNEEIGQTPFAPHTGKWALDQLRNLVIRYGNNLNVSGTLGQTTSDIGYQMTDPEGNPLFHTRGDAGSNATLDKKQKNNNGLQPYRVGIDGKTVPFESLMPQYLEKTGLRARKVYYVKEGQNAAKAKASMMNELNQKPEIAEQYGFDNRGVNDADKFTRLNAFIDQFNLKDADGEIVAYYIPGETVMMTRIPHNGPAFMGVSEVVGFTTSGASTIIVPSEYKAMIGADDDGDSLFVYREALDKNREEIEDFSEWNKAFKSMVKQWTKPEMLPLLNTKLDFEASTEATIARVDERLGKYNVKNIPFGFKAFLENFNNAVVSGASIGITFNTNKTYNILAPYKPILQVRDQNGRLNRMNAVFNAGNGRGIPLNGLIYDSVKKGNVESRVHRTTVTANVMLDSAKNHNADGLFLNPATAVAWLTLENLGMLQEDLAMLFRHPASQDYYSRILNRGNGYITNESEKQVIRKMMAKNIFLKKSYYSGDPNFGTMPQKGTGKGPILLDPKSKGYDSDENASKIIRLLSYLHEVSNDLNVVTNIIKGHKDLERNPHIMNEQVVDLESFLAGNNTDSLIQFSENMPEDLKIANNPEINSYLNTAKEWMEIQKKINLIYNENVKDVFEYIRNQVTLKPLTPHQTRHFSKILKPFLYSRFLGINNQNPKVVEALFTPPKKGEPMPIVNDIQEHLRDMYYSNSEPGQPNEYTLSFLFNHAVEVNNEEIGLMPGFLQNLSGEELKQVRKEFDNLPVAIQDKFVLYDLVMNSWEENRSLYPIFSNRYSKAINNNAKAFQEVQENITDEKSVKTIMDPILSQVKDHLLQVEINNENNNLPKIYVNERTVNTVTIRDQLKASGDRDLKQAFTDGKKEFVFEVIVQDNQQNKVKSLIFKYSPPLTNDGRAKDVIFNSRGNKDNKHTYLSEVKRKKMPEVDTALITIGDETTRGNEVPQKKKSNLIPTEQGGSGRASKGWYTYNTEKELSRSEFDVAMEYHNYVHEGDKDRAYTQYEADKAHANSLIDTYTPEKLANMDEQDLYEAYVDLGNRDQYATAIVMMPVLYEVNKRKMKEQMDLTKTKEGIQDTSVLNSWFQANNIESNHPATQAAARKIETEFKTFVNERKQYIRKINKVTTALYKDKLGLYKTGYGFIDKIHAAVVSLVRNRKTIYQKLYGNITESETRTLDGLGQKRIKLLSEDVLNKKYKAGTISKAELDFAKTFREITSELHPNAKYQSDFNTRGFVPAVAMSNFETLANRGLLGLVAQSHGADERIYNVRMNYKGENVSFKHIEDMFRTTYPNKLESIKEYVQLRLKAKKLLKQNQNEDGSPIDLGKVFNNTVLGTGMVNHFVGGSKGDGWIHEDDMLSMDLNKALIDFTHAQLFTEGNGKFTGFKKMQMQIDALQMHNQSKGFDNQAKFVQKVYKEYFLKGKRLSTPKDKVIDLMVRGNLLYIMGWKLMAVGKGVYLIGNVVIGKYMNVKNESTGKWLTGEKRYWGFEKGGFNPKKSTKILDNLNFMDINLYDNVNMSKSSGLDSLISDMALAPMMFSERWIQGVHLLGTLTAEQWSRFDEDGNYKPGAKHITNQELTELENEVKNAHGKGYTPTDQRMIQQYSWGRAMMQFSRFIPTVIYDRFSAADVNIYGKKHVGSLLEVKHLVFKITSGQIEPQNIPAYINSLHPDVRKRLISGLKGLAMVTLAGAAASTFNSDVANGLTQDANYYANVDKLAYKAVPNVIHTIKNLLRGLF